MVRAIQGVRVQRPGSGRYVEETSPVGQSTQAGGDGQFTEASGINDHGEVAGTFAKGRASNGNGNTQGFLYLNGKFAIVDAPGATRTDLFGLNNRDQAVGEALTDTATGTSVQDFIFFNGVFSDFSIPCAGAQINGINGRGQIVGNCSSSAFIFNSRTDGFIFINVPGAIDTQAACINDAGEIVGSFTAPAPVPEPSSLGLFGAGVLAMSYRLRRRRNSC